MKNKQLIEKMTVQQKAFFMSGASTWKTVAYEELGIPAIFLADGPHGLRKQEGASDHLGLNASVKATCFPTAATVANSWDEDLGEEIGRSLGAEARNSGVHVLLGPGLNIKRNPLCGRNFEYFSEDPIQAGKMAGAYVRGIQENGVVACPKHFAANNQETRRMTVDSIVDERTLREIYLTGFEIAVKEGKAKSIMTGYNKLNGVYANEDKWLLQDVLVDEWDFSGFVVSDWGGSNDHVLGVKNGSHLEMPTTGVNGAKEIVDAIHSGRLSERTLDERVDELLTVVLAASKAATEKSERTLEQHHEVAKRAARESIVLLKNENSLLPLNKQQTVGVIGDFAKTPRYQGAGSSVVNPTQLDSTLDVIEQYDLDYKGYAKGYHRSVAMSDELINEAVALAEEVEIVLLYVGLDEISESEGLDRKHLSLPQNQLDLIKAVSEVNKNIVAIVSAGSVIDMSWDKQVKAVLHGYLSGQAGAGAMLDVVVGSYCPSGKLSETYPNAYEDIPSSKDYPSKTNQTVYQEGPYIGYRYFETVEKTVKYPFGFGLSYTNFSYNNLDVTDKGVRFELTNTGSVDGAEVVQMYVGHHSNMIYRPKKELKAFKKIFLKAGESQQVEILFDDKTFRYYNVGSHSWEVESGDYEVWIGASVQDIRLNGTVQQKGRNIEVNYPTTSSANYFKGTVEKVTMEEFEVLLGSEVRIKPFAKGQTLEINDSISQLAYAKSGLARGVFRILNCILKKSEKKGKPNLNVLFIYNMTFRAVGKMTNGMVNHTMMEGVMVMVNGHFWKGLKRFIQAANGNRKLKKQGI